MLSMSSSFQDPKCGAIWQRYTLSHVSAFARVVVALLPGAKLDQKYSSSVAPDPSLTYRFMRCAIL